MTALAGSTGRHRLRVEVHDDWPRVEKVVQRQRVAVLIDRLEIGHLVSDIHWPLLPFSPEGITTGASEAERIGRDSRSNQRDGERGRGPSGP